MKNRLEDIWRRADRSARVMAVGVVAGALVGLRLGFMLDPTAATVLLILGLSLAFGGSSGAFVIVGLGLVERVRAKTTRWVDGAGAPLALMTVGAGMMIVAAVLLAAGVTEGVVVIGVAAIAACVVGWRKRKTERSTRLSLGLLVASMVLFHLPREMGNVSFELANGTQSRRTQANQSESCSGSGGALSVSRYHPAWVIDPSGLTGSLGEIVRERYAVGEFVPDRVVVRISGDVDFASPACYLPVYRFGDTHATLHLDYSFHFREPHSREPDGGEVSCSGGAQITLDIEADLTGVASCRDLEIDAAEQLMAGVVFHVRPWMGH